MIYSVLSRLLKNDTHFERLLIGHEHHRGLYFFREDHLTVFLVDRPRSRSL